MIYVYGFCDGNSVHAVAEYQRRFPNHRIPTRRVLTRVYQTLRDTGTLPGVRIAAESDVKFYTQSFHTPSSLYLHRKRPKPHKVTDTGEPPKETEDECASQTQPQEFMHPQEEYLHLHTSTGYNFLV